MSSTRPTYFESAEASDIGRKRKNNEDAYLRLPDCGLYCVADGMGGQAGGDLASNAIITSLQQVFSKSAAPDEVTFSQRIRIFREGTNQASKWIKNFSDEKAVGQMGSTVVGLIIDPQNPRRATSLHAGDSRLYRHRPGELRQITADHSAVAVLAAKLGRPPESLPAKYQNDLLRAVGLAESVELEKNSIQISSNDLFLLCSDGLTKMLTDQEIGRLLDLSPAPSLTALAHQLIAAANEAGGRDNVTVMLVKAGDLPPMLSDEPAELDDVGDEMTALAPTVLFPSEDPPTDTHPEANDVADIHGETPQTENPVATPKFPSGKILATAPAPIPVANIPAGRKGIPLAILLVGFALLIGAAVWSWFDPQFASCKADWWHRLSGSSTNPPATTGPAGAATNH